jgi:hypothetical protein
MEANWHLIPVENVISRLFFDVLADAPFKVVGELCAFMKPWDSNGWSVISYVDLDAAADERLIPIFERKRFNRTSPRAAALLRKKGEQEEGRVPNATLASGGGTPKVRL